jgi:hypothetical protein
VKTNNHNNTLDHKIFLHLCNDDCRSTYMVLNCLAFALYRCYLHKSVSKQPLLLSYVCEYAYIVDILIDTVVYENNTTNKFGFGFSEIQRCEMITHDIFNMHWLR